MAINFPEGTQNEPSKILKSAVYHSGVQYVQPHQHSSNLNSVNMTTSNTTSVWTASFTPIVSTSKIIGIYTCQEDAQGTNGFNLHSCFVGSTFLGGSQRYPRVQAEEPYTQSFQFEYDHNTSSAITFDMRYASSAGIYIILGRTYNYNSSRDQRWYGNNTALTLFEVSTT